MRKLSLAIAMAASLVLGVSGLAKAATVTQNIGTLNAASPSASFGYDPISQPDFKLDNTGAGTFRVNFTLGSDAARTATSITASAATGTALSKFTFGLYDSSNNQLAQVDQSTAFEDGTTFSSLKFANLLKSGMYYLLLTVTAGNAGQIINGNINIAAVPIPASLPMFGAVLAGLMIVQFRRRQTTTAS